LTRLTPIHREFITRTANGEKRDRIVCETLQKAFDALVEENLELGPTARITAESANGHFANQVLESAVACGWLPKFMAAADISVEHRKWLLTLLRARIHYFLDTPLEKIFGRESPKPDFVVIPVPDPELGSKINPEAYAREKPPLEPEVFELIEVEQHNIHKGRDQFSLMLFYSPGLLDEDPPPKRPVALCRTLGSYACALFDVEAKKYPEHLRLERWFTSLTYRVEENVMKRVTRRTLANLSYHATGDQMRAAIREALKAHAKKCLESPKKIAGSQPDDAAMSAARANMFDQTRGSNLTASQQQRIDAAERDLNGTFAAHEQMREIIDPGEWQPLGSRGNEPTMAGEIRKLERDIRKAAIAVLGVLAEASWALGSVEPFRARIETDARAVLEWILAKVNQKDLPLLDRAAIEGTIAAEISDWILKAQREFPPPWKTSAVPPEPSQAPNAAAPETRKAQKEPALSEMTTQFGDSAALNLRAQPPGPAPDPKNINTSLRGSGKKRKGDASLLSGKRAVTLRTAEQYLGISERQRQNLVKDQKLTVEGKGLNKRITTDSLRAYLPT